MVAAMFGAEVRNLRYGGVKVEVGGADYISSVRFSCSRGLCSTTTQEVRRADLDQQQSSTLLELRIELEAEIIAEYPVGPMFGSEERMWCGICGR